MASGYELLGVIRIPLRQLVLGSITGQTSQTASSSSSSTVVVPDALSPAKSDRTDTGGAGQKEIQVDEAMAAGVPFNDAGEANSNAPFAVAGAMRDVYTLQNPSCIAEKPGANSNGAHASSSTSNSSSGAGFLSRLLLGSACAPAGSGQTS